MFYSDLTDYSYSNTEEVGLTNIGWLSCGHKFERGYVAPSLIEKLYRIAERYPVQITRGAHQCDLCDILLNEEPLRIKDRAHSCERFLGSAEIRVPGKKGVYACPDLICHYVSHHHYRPPDEFLEALARYDYHEAPYVVSAPIMNSVLGEIERRNRRKAWGRAFKALFRLP